MSNVDDLQKEMAADIFNAFSWMIHDEIIDIKFVIPQNKLENGVFHTKFGIYLIFPPREAKSLNPTILFDNHPDVK